MPPTIDRLMKRLEKLAERLTAIGRLTKRLQELTEHRNAKEDPLEAVLEAVIKRLRAKGRGVRSGVRLLKDAHEGALGWDDKPPEVKQPEPSPKEPS
jgi:hypothetical protein